MRRAHWLHFLAGLLPLIAFLAGGCAGEEPAAGSCSYTYECDAGQVCKAGTCVSASELTEDGEGGAGGSAAGGSGGIGTGGSGAGGSGGMGGAGGAGGAGGVGGAEEEQPRSTFVPNDYRRCFDSLECAVFGGDCVVELTLSRPTDDGTERIPLSDLDPSLEPGQGLCAVPCTNEPRTCDAVVISGPNGESAPSTCQVVFAGESPYPEADLSFPFDHLLDPAALERGTPFAALCRPPFEHAEKHSPKFCAPCTEASQCGEGDGCWMERAFAATASGTCVQSCAEESDCPFGFACTEVTDEPLLDGTPGSYCLPVEDTCGRCLDMDGDGRGVGSCGPLDEPLTAVDCDDTNAAAYYDAAQPNHPFPQLCGEQDFNCNGISDRLEQLGSTAHCSDCGDACTGRVANGERDCQPLDESGTTFSCVAVCATGYADCNGDAEDGCEVPLESSMVWARDADGDGRGDPDRVRYFCDGEVEPGWVQNVLDCDDSNPQVYGGGLDNAGNPMDAALEICDGLDNDCDLVKDESTVVLSGGSVVAVAGEDCESGFPGVCAEGTLTCVDAATPDASMECVPNLDPEVRAELAESCNGLDDDCDGEVDEDADWFRDQGQTVPEGTPATCTIPENVGICALGAFACVDGSWSCIANSPESTDVMGDGVDSNCDGVDGDLSTAIFVRPNITGGNLEGNDANDGSSQQPVESLGRALELACAGGVHPCRDIYMEGETFTTSSSIELPAYSGSSTEAHVRIYGGFVAALACDAVSCELEWQQSGGRTTLIREAPAPSNATYPFGRYYAALENGSGSGAISLLMEQVDVHTSAPPPDVVLMDGEYAPAQIGLQCGVGGCLHLEFADVTLSVDDALSGGNGTDGQIAPALDGYGNGRDANQHGNGTDTGVNGTAGGGTAQLCPNGARPNGGSAGGRRTDNGGGNRGYSFYAGYGSGAGGGAPGCRAWKRSGSCDGDWGMISACGTTRAPGDGANGGSGSGASYISSSRSLEVQQYGNAFVPTLLSRYSASHGGNGGGGGGGAGCMSHGSCTGSAAPFRCASPDSQGNDVYGSGGGAGGCGGGAGGNGGHGGDAIGILLTPAAGPLRFLLDDSRPFLLEVGKGGNGGNGGKGGRGAGGGKPGALNFEASHAWMVNNAHYYQGGEGGDGAGGGGGAGGLGGNSVGIWQHCPAGGAIGSGSCPIQLPPRMRAQPFTYIQVGQAGAPGQGGVGGEPGIKSGSGSSGASAGADGADGLAGEAHAIHP